MSRKGRGQGRQGEFKAGQIKNTYDHWVVGCSGSPCPHKNPGTHPHCSHKHPGTHPPCPHISRAAQTTDPTRTLASSPPKRAGNSAEKVVAGEAQYPQVGQVAVLSWNRPVELQGQGRAGQGRAGQGGDGGSEWGRAG